MLELRNGSGPYNLPLTLALITMQVQKTPTNSPRLQALSPPYTTRRPSTSSSTSSTRQSTLVLSPTSISLATADSSTRTSAISSTHATRGSYTDLDRRSASSSDSEVSFGKRSSKGSSDSSIKSCSSSTREGLRLAKKNMKGPTFCRGP